MEKFDPFSQEKMHEIFSPSRKNPDRVGSRECGWLEFKESFGWNSLSKYLKSSAAFANTKGGYIIFGIGNRPHTLIGLKEVSLKMFDGVDPEKLSNHFNNHFSPEIQRDINQFELQGKTFGILYIYECEDKPVLCSKNAGSDIKEGDIYYRYRGRTERIKYPELKSILDIKREKEQKIWMQHFSNIARIGVQDAGIFDLQSGVVTGSGGTLLIDESLLNQLSFIKEGEFSEVKGKPALKLIGSVQPIGSIPSVIERKQIIKTKGIRIGDIVLSFLNNAPVSDPQEYIKQICFESSAYLPVFYYIHIASMKPDDVISMLEKVVVRSSSRTKLIERLRSKSNQYLSPSTGNTSSGKKKRDFLEALRINSIDHTIAEGDVVYCLQAIRSLSSEEIKEKSAFLQDLLRIWFNKHYSSTDSNFAGHLRKAICWVDEALYRFDIEKGS